MAVCARIGERVRELRDKLELSQEALAEKAGLASKHIQDIEHGRTNPTVATLVGLADALKVDVRDLFG